MFYTHALVWCHLSIASSTYHRWSLWMVSFLNNNDFNFPKIVKTLQKIKIWNKTLKINSLCWWDLQDSLIILKEKYHHYVSKSEFIVVVYKQKYIPSSDSFLFKCLLFNSNVICFQLQYCNNIHWHFAIMSLKM